MIDLRKVRRQRKALELVCLLLKVDDKVLDNYVKTGKLPKAEKEPKKVEKKAEEKKVTEKVVEKPKAEKVVEKKDDKKSK